ncbi:MAG: MBL fold metallo-hydrolase [Parcubacteria group bacterium]|nr:MBL fold metallo-hydrolase [Parcubacteria group bacterium]
MSHLSFFGGVEEVTGSNYLLEHKDKKILIDCGMFQGSRFAEEKNFEPFPYNPKKIDFLAITHSHIDHIGRIPKLYREGFRGKIFSTRPIKDFAELFLSDSLKQLEDIARDFKKEPFFDEKDLIGAMNLFETYDYGEKIDLGENFYLIFRDAGHILGSSIIEVFINGQKLAFTGDLGNPPTPILKPTERISNADWLIMEATYGNRLHEDKLKRKTLLERAIEDTVTQGGVLMIPAFAMERTQEILYELDELVKNHRIPRIPIFIDSPLAIKATNIYKKYTDYYNQEAISLIRSGEDFFRFSGLKFTETKEESKKINDVPAPKIIIAGSGMSNGGRILHHERRYLADPKSLLLIIGYQAFGSLGRRLLDGEKEVRLFGETIPVRARVRAIGGYSAHADQEGLLEFVSNMRETLKKVFLVHGEFGAAETLALKIKDEMAIEAIIPKFGEKFEI